MSITRFCPVHFGWVIVATGALVLFSCLGLARFAYTMLLPSMQAGLGLPIDRMGLIGTANFIGYLVAVILSPLLVRRFRPRPTITAALLLIAAGMIGISLSQSLSTISILYALVGMGSGFANIPLMVLVTYWFSSEQRGKAAGLMISGNGMAIIFAGYLIPLLNRSYGPSGWRSGWLVLGLISLAVAACSGFVLRNHPSELGLELVGRRIPIPLVKFEPRKRPNDRWILFCLGVLYFTFGITFMSYGTFIVASMIGDYGFSEQKAGFYWSWVGFFSMFSGVGFGALSDYIGRKRGIALVFTVQTVAYLLASLKIGPTVLMASIVLYGLTVFAIPAIMAAAVGDYLGLSRAAGAFAAVTLFFAFGQTLGPAAAGFIGEKTGSFAAAYQLASVLTASAALLAILLPAPERNP